MFTWFTPALQKGYALAVFDGPGQGITARTPPYTTLIPQWDQVVSSVLKAIGAVATLAPLIDLNRTALVGESTAGYLAGVACTALGPSVLKACVLSPPSLDLVPIYLQPTAAGLFSPMTYIAQHKPSLLPKGTSPATFLDPYTNILLPLLQCPPEYGAQEYFNGFFQGMMAAEGGLLDIDLWYTIWKFGGFRAATGVEMAGFAYQAFQSLMAFNSSLAVGSSVPTLLTNNTEDSAWPPSSAGSIFQSLASDAVRAASRVITYDAASGAAEHCSSGGLMLAQADMFAWLNPIMHP